MHNAAYVGEVRNVSPFSLSLAEQTADKRFRLFLWL